MSEIDEGRPLTRRELRLLGLATGSIEIDGGGDPNTNDADTEASPHDAALNEMASGQMPQIDISLYDESGRMRSRREIRALRDEIEAKLAEQQRVDEHQHPSEDELAVDDEVSVDGEAPVVEELAVIDEPPPTEPIGIITDEIEIVTGEIEITAEPQTEPAVVASDAVDGENLEAEASPATSQYSFPDIVPIEEAPSVLDDPAHRMMGASGETSATDLDSGFDELITRAVSQESAANTSSTSALILPSMPETDTISGPIGETGEILFTGSLSLPKSLGETGSHSSLHDASDSDPLEEYVAAEAHTADGHMAPVSAVKAVSVQSATGAMVSQAANDKSKLPAVLITVGGLLVLVAAGLVVWAAVNGLFG